MVAALGIALPAAHGAGAPCEAKRVHAHARVQHVFDGDTFKLGDGRHVRLIGIDTPEMNHDQPRAPQPGAVAARQALRRMLARHDHRVALQYGTEPEDDYGRTLAHAYLPDGSNLTARLLRGGYGTALAVPPNLWAVDCYGTAEQAARSRRLGIWGTARYQPVSPEQLDPRARGFHIVAGRVERIGRSRRALWVDFGPVAARIDRRDQRYFDGTDWQGLVGRRIEVRGWLYRRNGELRMQLRHPAALRLLP